LLRGTKFISGIEAEVYRKVIEIFSSTVKEGGYEEIIIPTLWEQQTFIDKAGQEIINQMWAFKDKGNRDVCLIPEATAPLQEMWRDDWSKRFKEAKIFYTTKCYRYERPQKGRYREFTQFGIENLGNYDKDDSIRLLKKCLDNLGCINYDFSDSVKRGLTYYTEDGFEAVCNSLGAQKQLAGGGKYNEGVGWAVGIERLILAIGTGNHVAFLNGNI
jgi:histidyl-tRNA synthetase